MSYTIIYNKLFVSLGGDKYIPMVQIGDNNVYDMFNNKRSRDWHNLYQPIMSIVDMDAEIEKRHLVAVEYSNNTPNKYNERKVSVEEYLSSFGYYEALAIGGTTSNTTFGKYKAIFTNGVKKAISFEQAVELGLNVCIYGEGFVITERKYPNTVEEYIDIVTSNKTVWVYFDTNSVERYLKDLRWVRKINKQNKAKEQLSMYYVVYSGNGGYVKKRSSRRIWSVSRPENAMKFKTEKLAKDYIKKCSGYKTMFYVEKIENKDLVLSN